MRATVIIAEEKVRRDAIIRNATTKRKINKKRVIWYGLAILSIAIGFVLLLCNITMTLPAAQWGESVITDTLIFFIAYAFLLGPLFILLGGLMVMEDMMNTVNHPRKKRTR